MEKLMTFIDLVAWIVAIIATIGTLGRIFMLGKMVKRGSQGSVHNHGWWAIAAVVAWLWLIAGWVM